MALHLKHPRFPGLVQAGEKFIMEAAHGPCELHMIDHD